MHRSLRHNAEKPTDNQTAVKTWPPRQPSSSVTSSRYQTFKYLTTKSARASHMKTFNQLFLNQHYDCSLVHDIITKLDIISRLYWNLQTFVMKSSFLNNTLRTCPRAQFGSARPATKHSYSRYEGTEQYTYITGRNQSPEKNYQNAVSFKAKLKWIV